MLSVLGDIIPFAVGVALSPIPLIVSLLIVMAPVGGRGGAAFVATRALALAVLVAVFAVGAELIDGVAGASSPAAVLRIVIGALLIVVAVGSWLRRPRADEPSTLPPWMSSIDRTGVGGAARLGVVVTVANPKELAFAAAAGLTIGGASMTPGPTVAGIVIFAVLANVGVATPVVAVLVGGSRIRPALGSARRWLERNNGIVMAAVLLLIGAMVLGNGISGLAAP